MLFNTLVTLLTSQIVQNWQTNLCNFQKCINYGIYKTNIEFEKYLNILDGKYLQVLINFRLCNN